MWKWCVVVAGLMAIAWPVHSVLAEGVVDSSRLERVHRVVMHLNSGDENVQRGALNNIRHLYQEIGRARLQLELVVHGPALGLLTKKTTKRKRNLRQSGLVDESNLKGIKRILPYI